MLKSIFYARFVLKLQASGNKLIKMLQPSSFISLTTGNQQVSLIIFRHSVTIFAINLYPFISTSMFISVCWHSFHSVFFLNWANLPPALGTSRPKLWVRLQLSSDGHIPCLLGFRMDFVDLTLRRKSSDTIGTTSRIASKTTNSMQQATTRSIIRSIRQLCKFTKIQINSNRLDYELKNMVNMFITNTR